MGCNDKDHTRLTDGYLGNPTGGGSYWSKSAGWDEKTPDVSIDLDLGQETHCAAIGLSSCGDNALSGGIARRQSVEVLVSSDGKEFKSIGMVDFRSRYKNIPYNYMLADEEDMSGGAFYVPLPKPVNTRYIRYHAKFKSDFLTTELLVHDSVTIKPYPVSIALPGEE
jgi:hypothetical protein